MQKRGYHDFSIKIFCLTVLKTFVGEPFVVSENFGYRKILCIRERVSRFFVENFLSHNTKNFRLWTFWCFRKFRVSQNFMHKKGMSLNSVEMSLSHSADKVRKRTLLCFEGILVSKIFKQRRGEASRFCRNFFHLTGPKKFRQGVILCFRKFLMGKINLWIRGGITFFRRKFLFRSIISLENTLVFQKISFIEKFHASRFCQFFFVPQDGNQIFLKEPFCFAECFCYRKKFMNKRSHITISRRIFYVSQCRNFSWGSPTVFEKNSGFEKFHGWKWGITFFRQKFLVSQYRKNLWASIQGFRNFGVSKTSCIKGDHNFVSEIFCLTVAKDFVKEPFSVSLS